MRGGELVDKIHIFRDFSWDKKKTHVSHVSLVRWRVTYIQLLKENWLLARANYYQVLTSIETAPQGVLCFGAYQHCKRDPRSSTNE